MIFNGLAFKKVHMPITISYTRKGCVSMPDVAIVLKNKAPTQGRGICSGFGLGNQTSSIRDVGY